MSIKLTQVGNVSMLIRGQIVRNKGSGLSYVIIADDSDYPMGVRTVEISNAQEWLLIERELEYSDDSPE